MTLFIRIRIPYINWAFEINLFSRVDLELSKSNLAMGEIKMADSRWQNIDARSAQINASYI